MVVTLDWDNVKLAEWDRLFAAIPRSVLEQSWAYGEAAGAAQGHRVRRALFRRGKEAIGCVQVLDGSFFGLLQIVEILRGPLWRSDVVAEEKRAGLAAIRQSFRLRKRELLLWMPELTDMPDSHAEMRRLGMRPMLTGYSSIWLSLAPGPQKLRLALDGKWRNVLNRAEQSKLRVQVTQGGRALDWLLERHDAFREARRFRAPSGRLVRAFAAAVRRKSDVAVAAAYSGSEPVAGALWLSHGKTSTYYVGWTGPEGRETGAQNLVLWRSIEVLHEAGIATLDLGGIDTRRAPGIARFKLGLGGEVFTLSGTWL
jgi:hypothetical protein